MVSTTTEAPVPADQQISISEIDKIEEQLGREIIDLARTDPDYRGPEGRQNDAGCNLSYVGTMRVVVAKDAGTGKFYSLNYTEFIDSHLIEFREGLSIENGVMGGRIQALGGLVAKLGTVGSFLAPLLAGGAAIPAILVNAATSYLTAKSKPGSLLAQILARLVTPAAKR